MRAEEAVQRLQSTGRREVTAIRTVGYAILIEKGDWELIEQLMDADSAVMLRRAFEEAAVMPEEITFPAGNRAFLEELVRSSYHPAAAQLGQCCEPPRLISSARIALANDARRPY